MTNWVQLLRDLVCGNVEHYEKVYPLPDGEGTAGALIALNSDANNATDAALTTQNYYGEPKRIVPVDVGGDFAIDKWRLIGIILNAETAAKDFKWELLRVVKATESDKTGGAAWAEGATVLTLNTDEGANFLNGDKVWISSGEQPEGEIVEVSGAPAGDVVTIARETVNMATPNGLRWAHTTNPKMFLCRRPAGGYRRIHGIFAAPSTKVTHTQRFHAPRVLKANDGLIARIINMTDSTDNQILNMAILYDRGTVWGE